MRFKGISLKYWFFILCVIVPGIAHGLNDRNVDVYGFLLGNYSGRIHGEGPALGESGDFLLAEERIRLDISAWSESIEASARVKGDFFHDALADDFDMDLREAYADYSTGGFDLRLGRQIATWGVGDLLFINDVFPKDYVSFFSGRPLEYLKIGVDGIRFRYSSDIVNAVFFLIPFFEPDNLPTSDRFFLFDPFAEVSQRETQEPESSYGNTELALRLYRKLSDIDISLYAYRGFWRIPGIRPDNLEAPTRLLAFYPPLSVYGMSVQKSALGGVLSFETGYYQSRDDADGNDPAIPNSQYRFLFGYHRQAWPDATVGIQYYAEVMEDYSAYQHTLPEGFPAQNEYRDVVTFRFDQLWKHQTWMLSMMCFYGLADSDYLLQPQVSYKFSDNLAATMGANIFGGQHDWTYFGQFEKNDNIYLSIRFDF